MAKQNQEERHLLRDMAVFASDAKTISAKSLESLMERSFAVGSTIKDPANRASDTPNDLSVLKPQDKGWVGRLTSVTGLKATKALALVNVIRNSRSKSLRNSENMLMQCVMWN